MSFGADAMGVPLMHDKLWGCFGICVVVMLIGGASLMMLATLFYR